MKVGVIGGGIAGLTSAYKLDRKGVDVEVFEKDNIPGGRSSRALRLLTAKNKNILNLMEELGIRKNLRELSPGQVGAYMGGEINTFDAFVPLLLPKEELTDEQIEDRKELAEQFDIDLKSLDQLFEEVNNLPFAREDRSDEIEELHNTSMEEWMSKYDEAIQDYLIKPMMELTFVDDLSTMSADRGACHVKVFFDIFKYGGYIVTNGPFAISRAIKEELGDKLKLTAEVLDVEEKPEGIEVTYEIGGEKSSEKFDKVVFATPLNTTGKLLDEEFEMEYNETSYTIVNGELKTPCEMVIGTEKDFNFRALYSIGDSDYVYPRDVFSGIDLSELYKEGYSTMGSGDTVSMPLIEPGINIPDLKYSDRIFLAGDFYHYPYMETAVITGEKVADMIMG